MVIISDNEITVIRTEVVGKGGGRRTVHHLSNGWWINDLGQRGQREHRFSLYKPTVGNSAHGTFVKGDNNLKNLLRYANRA